LPEEASLSTQWAKSSLDHFAGAKGEQEVFRLLYSTDCSLRLIFDFKRFDR
jgi:hypothetical protein